METIKFNCYDLADAQSRLLDLRNTLQVLCEELAAILKDMDQDAAGYDELRRQLASSQSALMETDGHFLRLCNVLDCVVDIYGYAESKAIQAAESLPLHLSDKSGGVAYASTAPPVGASAITSRELYIEDWLTELLFNE
jgi:hypothetical protein